MSQTNYDLSCACGGVRLHIAAELNGSYQCYCQQCRHASGGGPATFVMAPRAAVQVEGEVAAFAEPTASGNQASRSFCPKCGTAVYSEPGSVPHMLAIKLSMFKDAPWREIKAVFWTEEAPDWANIDPTIPVAPAQNT